MGKVGKVIAGVALIVTGVVVGVFTGQWTLALALASSGVGLLTMPKMPHMGQLNERQGAILQNRVGSMDRLPVVYGTTRIGGVFADMRVWDGYPERKLLVLVSAFCHGSRDGSGVTAIDEVWFDDRLAIQGSVVQAPFSNPQPNLIKHLEYTHHLGASTQTVDGVLNVRFPVQWPTTAAGKGICYSRFDLYFNQDVYPGGIPNIQLKIRGNKVYDPRDATWKHSTNPALCIRDYMLSTIYGMGIPEANLEEQSFIDMANYCDELVTLPDATTQKRFEMNGWVDTHRSVEANLAELCTACRGQVVNEGDRWRLIIRRARSVSDFEINEHNTVEGTWQFILPGSDSAPNVIRASYVDPSRNYDVDVVQWPDPGQVNPYLTDDNAYEQRLEVDLPFTDNRFRAQQIGMTLLKESREAIGAVCTLKEEALQIRVGDLVPVTQPTPGWVDKVFDVAALLLQPDGQVRAILVEYEPTVYDLSTQFPQPVAQDTNLPDPFSVSAPTSLVLASIGHELIAIDGGYIPRIKLTWSKSNDPFVSYYEIQAKKATESDWDTYGRHAADDPAVFYITPVTQDETWDVRIRAVNTIGRRSDWVTSLHVPQVPDPRPQVLTATLTNAHGDVSHVDQHTDNAHADSAHADTHTDTPHVDHTDHSDVHSDSGTHDDVAHGDEHDDIGEEDTDHTDVHTDNPHSDHSDGHADSHTDNNHQDAPHSDTHEDVGLLDTDHTDFHSDNAHADHTDSALSHTDSAHVDNHTDNAHGDTAHADGHVDEAHGDNQFGVGVAVQADNDAASLRAVARKGSANLLTNGSAESGTLGAVPTGWTFGAGNNVVSATDFFKHGARSFKVINGGVTDSYIYQDVAVVAGVRYRIQSWIKTSALPAADAGNGAAININIVSGVTSFTIVSKVGDDFTLTEPDVGILADGVAHDWEYVESVFIPTADGTIRVHLQLGFGGGQSGTAWWDDVRLVRVHDTGNLPDEDDVRKQAPVDGRNVVIVLNDAASGKPFTFLPGETAEIAVVAYSETGGLGVEGPLARARGSLFSVAPVGTDQWVPS